MRSHGTARPDERDLRCEVCKLPSSRCACEALPRVRPLVPIVIIQHAREKKVCGNTGSLAGHVLIGSTVVPYGDPVAPFDLARTLDPGIEFQVLFPTPGASVVGPRLGRPGARTSGLIVLDATWSQARKMSQRIEALRRLPFVRLPEGSIPRFALRTPPGRGQFGTAEALALALEAIGDREAAAALRVALASVAAVVLGERGKLPARKRRRPHVPRGGARPA
jgi:DTW domain-containing protein YfiP